MYRVLLFLLFSGIGSTAHAADAIISLSTDSALMKFNLWVGGQSYGRSQAGIGVLFNDTGSYLVETSFHVVDEVGTRPKGLVLALGTKLYGAYNTDTEHSALAMAIGGSFNYTIPGTQDRLFIGVDAYGAPTILTTLDGQWFWEWAGNIGYKILQEQADVFIGYRQFGTALTDDRGVEFFDSSPRLGFKIIF